MSEITEPSTEEIKTIIHKEGAGEVYNLPGWRVVSIYPILLLLSPLCQSNRIPHSNGSISTGLESSISNSDINTATGVFASIEEVLMLPLTRDGQSANPVEAG
jgi:hypothetical protein